MQEVAAPVTTPPQPVEESAPPVESTGGATRADAPAPKYQSGSINDFLPILESTAEVVVEPILLEVMEEADVPVVSVLPDVIPLLVPSEILPDWETDGWEKERPIPESNGQPKPTAPTPVTDRPPVSAKATPEEKPKKKERSSSPVVQVEEAEIAQLAADVPKEIVWSDSTSPPQPPAPREIVWSDEEPPPAILNEAAGERSTTDEHESESANEHDEESTYRRYSEDDDDEFKPRRRKRGRRRVLLIFGILVILGGLGGGGWILMNYLGKQPARTFEQAKKEYEKKNFDQARKLFEDIVTNHPDFPQVTEAKFMMELSGFRLALSSVTVESDPTQAHQKLKSFLGVLDDPPMQEFGERFRPDIWDTVKRLAESTLAKSKNVFKLESPDESEQWLKQAADLEPVVARFRPKELEKEREQIFGDIDLQRLTIQKAYERQQNLVVINNILGPEPDDPNIVDARNKAKEVGLENDPAVSAMLQEAEKKIQGRWVYRRLDEPLAPIKLRESGMTGLLFAGRLDPEGNRPARVPGPASVFFALARGVLYALDENDGHVLWATRVGIDSDSLPTRIPADDLNPEEMVLVTVNDGNRSSLTARRARTGEPVWHQPLSTPGVGQPIVVGQRVFVPTSEKPVDPKQPVRRDEKGVVLEFEIRGGYQLGKLALGRPLGAGGVLRPGTGLLFFPAEARGVYVFDVEKHDDQGQRLDPQLLGIVNTEHPAGTLRGEPVLANVEGDAPGPRYLILNQADGLNEMKLRAFPFPAPGAPQVPSGTAVEIPFQGWSWFPPYCDSEKLAIVTDRGEFGLFGINQENNNDRSLFVIPPEPYQVGDARKPARGQVVYADENAFWILARGQLQHILVGFDAKNGLKLVPRGTPLQLGEPLHAAQVNQRKDLIVVVTQASSSASCRATAFDPNTGHVRWQRQLGLVTQGPPVVFGKSIIIMDQDAGLYLIDPQDLTLETNNEWLIKDRWSIAQPLLNVASPPTMLPQADGKSIVVVAAVESSTGLRLVIRRYSADNPVQDRSVVLPAPLAGNPILVNGMLILPLANGMLHRLSLAEGKAVEEGPTWRGARLGRSTKCYLVPFQENDFFATDGNRILQRWRWPQDQDIFESRGQLTLSDPIASAPVLIPGVDRQRLLLASVKGIVTTWDADKLAPNAVPLRTWRPLAKGPIPVGPITAGPFLERDPKGNPIAFYLVDGVNLVVLSPDVEGPLWISRRADRLPGDGTIGKPQLFENRLYLTDRLGIYRAIDMETREALGAVYRITGTGAAATPALPFEGGRLLAPLTDGTVLLVVPEKKKVKLPFLLIPIGPLGVPFVPVPWTDE